MKCLPCNGLPSSFFGASSTNHRGGLCNNSAKVPLAHTGRWLVATSGVHLVKKSLFLKAKLMHFLQALMSYYTNPQKALKIGKKCWVLLLLSLLVRFNCFEALRPILIALDLIKAQILNHLQESCNQTLQYHRNSLYIFSHIGAEHDFKVFALTP